MRNFTIVTEITSFDNWEKKYKCYISNSGSMFNEAAFIDKQQLDNFLTKYCLEISEESTFSIGRRWKLNKNFKHVLFWDKKDIPINAIHTYAMCNGSLVDCYIQSTENELIIYKPNPNAKDVYKPYTRGSIEYVIYNKQFYYI